MNRFFNFKAFAYFFSILGLLALSCSLALGQAISGNVVGTVVDSSGAAVAGAEVTAHNVATGITSLPRRTAPGDIGLIISRSAPTTSVQRQAGFRPRLKKLTSSSTKVARPT